MCCNRFRWAACQLDSRKTCLSARSVQRALSSLPKTLDETNGRMLLNIDDGYQEGYRSTSMVVLLRKSVDN